MSVRPKELCGFPKRFDAEITANRKGGSAVCSGIHRSDIPSFPYSALWEERVVRSAANLARRDGGEFLTPAAQFPLLAEVHPSALMDANRALDDLRAGVFAGSAVLSP